MSNEFFESVGNIRTVSIDALKTIRAVRGEHYARLVHSVILCNQIDSVLKMFAESCDPQARELGDALANQASSMMTKVMQYYMRSSQFTQAQLEEVFKDAETLQNNASDLLKVASDMAERGQVMGE